MKQKIINFLLCHLLNPVILEDVVTIEKGVLHLGGKPITQGELNQLQAEIKALNKARIWSILINTPRKVAQDKIFNQATNFQDVMAGKMMLFNLDTQESILRVIKNKK